MSDPDPDDDWILAEYEFTLREADGTVRVVSEAHRLGSFSRDTWLRLLAATGFEAEVEPAVHAGDSRAARVIFALACRAHAGSAGVRGSHTRNRVSPGTDSTRRSPW